MTITLVRHAEVIEEYQGRYNGHIDISLSENGKHQAKELGEALKKTHFDKVFCSDLLRARETFNELNIDAEAIFSSRLREKSWGRHEGKSFSEIEAEGIEYKNFEQWIDALDGEDMQVYTENLKNYFNETLLKQETQNILIITHSGVIKTLLHLTQDISLEEAFSTHLPYSSSITLDTIPL